MLSFYIKRDSPRRDWAIDLLKALCASHGQQVIAASGTKACRDSIAIVIDPQAIEWVKKLVEKHGKVIVVFESKKRLDEFLAAKVHKAVVTNGERPAETARRIAEILEGL